LQPVSPKIAQNLAFLTDRGYLFVFGKTQMTTSANALHSDSRPGVDRRPPRGGAARLFEKEAAQKISLCMRGAQPIENTIRTRKTRQLNT